MWDQNLKKKIEIESDLIFDLHIEAEYCCFYFFSKNNETARSAKFTFIWLASYLYLHIARKKVQIFQLQIACVAFKKQAAVIKICDVIVAILGNFDLARTQSRSVETTLKNHNMKIIVKTVSFWFVITPSVYFCKFSLFWLAEWFLVAESSFGSWKFSAPKSAQQRSHFVYRNFTFRDVNELFKEILITTHRARALWKPGFTRWL